MKVKLHSGHCPLRAVIITGGIGASILFVIVGVIVRLQLFGDGSIFCYAIAAQDAWLFHWHNISGRLFLMEPKHSSPQRLLVRARISRASSGRSAA